MDMNYTTVEIILMKFDRATKRMTNVLNAYKYILKWVKASQHSVTSL